MSRLRIASALLLCLIYLSAYSALTVRQAWTIIRGTGKAQVQPHTGGTKEFPRPIWVQRRHISLVKEFSPPAPPPARMQPRPSPGRVAPAIVDPDPPLSPPHLHPAPERAPPS